MIEAVQAFFPQPAAGGEPAFRDLEPFGAEHQDTRQHKAAVAKARKSHTEGAGTFFAWLADTDDPAIATALRQQVPRPVLFLLTALGGRSYKRSAAAAWD